MAPGNESRRLRGERWITPRVDESAIHGAHDHVDGPEDGHDVGHLVSLEDVGKDLQIIAVRGADFEAPRGDIVVALNEHADLAFA